MKKTGVTVIGVTGSVGKTTTKDMLTAICSCKFRTSCTQGNHNSDIGLPLTVLSMDADTEVAVLEMGMNHPGEIHDLAKIARPHIAVITTVGSAHIEFFGTRENIMKAKMEITDFLEPYDTLVVNSDCDLLAPGNVAGDYAVMTAGSGRSNDFIISDVENLGEEGMAFTLSNMWMSERFEIPATGIHNVGNAAVAVAAASCLGITMEEAARSLKKAVITEGRLQYRDNGRIKVIDDTYNASPEAMEAAIDQLIATEGGKKIAVLGDMYELGENGIPLHERVGAYAAEKGVDLVIGVGALGEKIAEGAGAAGRAAPTREKALKILRKNLDKGDVVLVKASHAMELDMIVREILKK